MTLLTNYNNSIHNVVTFPTIFRLTYSEVLDAQAQRSAVCDVNSCVSITPLVCAQPQYGNGSGD